jgi:hypothetical protein
MLDGMAESDNPEMKAMMSPSPEMPQDKPLLHPEFPYDSGTELEVLEHASRKKHH